MEAELQDIRKELIELRIAVEMIKKAVLPQKDPEGELSDWAKQELTEARATPRSEFTSHEEVKQMILQK